MPDPTPDQFRAAREVCPRSDCYRFVEQGEDCPTCHRIAEKMAEREAAQRKALGDCWKWADWFYGGRIVGQEYASWKTPSDFEHAAMRALDEITQRAREVLGND